MPSLTRKRRGIIPAALALIAILGLTAACETNVTTQTTAPTPPITAVPTRAPVEFIVLRPDAVTLQVGQTQQFTATAFDQLENPIPNLRLTYVVEDLPQYSWITQDGLLFVHLPGSGTVKVRATHGDVARSGTANVTVVAAEAAAVSLGGDSSCALTPSGSLKPESTEGRPWRQPLKKPSGAPLNLG